MNISAEWLTIIGMAGALLWSIVNVSVKLGGMQLKLDILWGYLRRQAVGSSVQQGMGEVNSPFRLTEKGRTAFPDDMVKRLQEFYREKGHKLNEQSLWFAIEKAFGEEISTRLVVHPTEILQHHDVAVLAAINIAKEGMAGESETK